MALHDDLLDQARHLLGKEPRRPKQASLRRAVSAAYYAIFHLLVFEAALRLVKGGPWPLRTLLQRAFDHAEMKRTSKSFAAGVLPAGMSGVLADPIPIGLRLVSQTFVDLQQARHEADYDLSRSFARSEVRDLLVRVEKCFSVWSESRDTDAAHLYLIALLVGERLRRRTP